MSPNKRPTEKEYGPFLGVQGTPKKGPCPKKKIKKYKTHYVERLFYFFGLYFFSGPCYIFLGDYVPYKI